MKSRLVHKTRFRPVGLKVSLLQQISTQLFSRSAIKRMAQKQLAAERTVRRFTHTEWRALLIHMPKAMDSETEVSRANEIGQTPSVPVLAWSAYADFLNTLAIVTLDFQHYRDHAAAQAYQAFERRIKQAGTLQAHDFIVNFESAIGPLITDLLLPTGQNWPKRRGLLKILLTYPMNAQILPQDIDRHIVHFDPQMRVISDDLFYFYARYHKVFRRRLHALKITHRKPTQAAQPIARQYRHEILFGDREIQQLLIQDRRPLARLGVYYQLLVCLDDYQKRAAQLPVKQHPKAADRWARWSRFRVDGLCKGLDLRSRTALHLNYTRRPTFSQLRHLLKQQSILLARNCLHGYRSEYKLLR